MASMTPAEIKAANNDKIGQLRARIEELKNDIKNERKIKDDCHGISAAERLPKAIGPTPRARRILKGHFGKVYAMHWAGDSRHIVSASQDGKLIVWNGFTTNKASSIPLRSSWVMTCAFEQSQSAMVACGGLDNLCSIYQIGATVSKASKELHGHEGYLSCCRFDGESKILTSSGDSTCKYWDIETGECETFRDHAGDVMSVAFSPTDHRVFISGSCDSHVKVWDLRTNHCTMTFTGHDSDVNSVAFFPNGHAFGTGSDDSSCRLFDLRYYGEVNSFSANAKELPIVSGVTSVSFSLSGRLLFAGYEDTFFHVWDTMTCSNTPAFSVGAHDQRVSCLGVNGKGDALCTGSWDTQLKIWA